MGYSQAGWTDITGVDIAPQPHYPFTFVQGDALEYLRDHGDEFDVIHASPPCQRYTIGAMAHGTQMNHPDSVPPILESLHGVSAIWIVENVPMAPLPNAITLCGAMFGLRVIRHRLFASNVLLGQPRHVPHNGMVKTKQYVSVAGHGGHGSNAYPVWAAAMQIDWMSKLELAQAVPPAYTRYIAEQIQQRSVR